jgi:hypothetical protein
MKLIFILFLCITTIGLTQAQAGTFEQEKRQFFGTENGLPDLNIDALFLLESGLFYANSASGLSYFADGAFKVESATSNLDILGMHSSGDQIQILHKNSDKHFLAILENHEIIADIAIKNKGLENVRLLPSNLICTNDALYTFDPTAKKIKIQKTIDHDLEIRNIAAYNEDIWIAADNGLYTYNVEEKSLTAIFPSDKNKSWAPKNVIGVTLADDALWFASPQGVGSYDGENWALYTGAEGLPYDQFTCLSAGSDGAVWFGTEKGAIRFDGDHWSYRQGLRWLPGDTVNDIAVDDNGNAWIATDKGLSFIERVPMTLAEKAKFYEDEIDRYNRRTPYGYVLEANMEKAGDKSNVRNHDSDNDGLWTSMYGAGECYAWAVTRDPVAKKRADDVYEAMEFLGTVTQGGSHPAPPGYVARTILPTSGPNPNDGRVARDKKTKENEDGIWKVIDPRWPVSEDSVWYWKSDTSSDELDGHYYFYGLYYDLVAETDAEKTRVREHVRKLTDHLVMHDYQMVDHDGIPTRWARFNPYEMNHDVNWVFDRNLNSLSMLSFLITAAHITEDEAYIKYAEYLVENHGYLQNAQLPKTQRGIGTGNQSDDEMALMCLYNFIKYSPHQEWTDRMALALWTYGRLELPEMNPFFNYVYASKCEGTSFTDAWGKTELKPTGDWKDDALHTLQHFPLDRIDWRHDNSQRIDIVPIEDIVRHFDEGSYANRGRRVNGKVIPVDECHFNHWNRNPYALVTGGGGHGLADGAVYLLPYYMGLYYGYID